MNFDPIISPFEEPRRKPTYFEVTVLECLVSEYSVQTIREELDISKASFPRLMRSVCEKFEIPHLRDNKYNHRLATVWAAYLYKQGKLEF